MKEHMAKASIKDLLKMPPGKADAILSNCRVYIKLAQATETSGKSVESPIKPQA
jgi:hypothetical protein